MRLITISLLSGAAVAQSEVEFLTGELLGRPTDTSITVNTMADRDLEVCFEYGVAPGVYTGQTPVTTFPGNKPIETVIDQLQPNTRYYYRMRYREPGSAGFTARDEHTFHTQRPPGSSFTFAIEADPHLDEGCNPDVYRLTLENALADQPDFLIDLGDTFMSDKLRPPTYEGIVERHLLLRSFFT